MDFLLVLALGFIYCSGFNVPGRTLLKSYLVDLLVKGLELMHQGVSLNLLLSLHSSFDNWARSLCAYSQGVTISHDDFVVFRGNLLSLRALYLFKALSKYAVFLF